MWALTSVDRLECPDTTGRAGEDDRCEHVFLATRVGNVYEVTDTRTVVLIWTA